MIILEVIHTGVNWFGSGAETMCNQTPIMTNVLFFAAKKTLPQLRQLYFSLKERVFSSSGPFGIPSYDSAELEKFYKEELGTHMTMDSVSHPR